MRQPLWLNTNIKANNDLLYNSNAIDIGFTLIAHTMDENGKFHSYAEIRQKSNNTVTYMQYYSTIDAIKIEWKRIMRHDTSMGEPRTNYVHEILSKRNINSLVYGS